MLTALGRRWTWGVLFGLLFGVISPTSAAPMPVTARSVDPNDGPGSAPLTARVGSLTCRGDLAGAARTPVLLVPGTGLTPRENWGPTYLPVLVRRGHPVCLVRLPAFGTDDVQRNTAYVGAAIRAMALRAGRRISVIGHSQGAFLPRVALRTWPSLAKSVDDVIGLAGVYDHGSREVARRCVRECMPVLQQLATGSAFLRAISRLRLPTGPSYTSIGATGDLTVTPQPLANHQPGAKSVMVQDVCPGHDIPEPQHAMIAGDAVALALVLDALDHRGTAAGRRIIGLTCLQQQYPQFDQEAFFAGALAVRDRQLAAPVATEPAVWCRYRPGCRARLR